jgi:hypothetical protein
MFSHYTGRSGAEQDKNEILYGKAAKKWLTWGTQCAKIYLTCEMGLCRHAHFRFSDRTSAA